MNVLVVSVLLLVGLLHLVPAIGVLGPHKLQTLYGHALTEPDLILLMRHRAILFGLLGAGMVLCAFKPEWRLFGLIAGLVSVGSFLILALQSGGAPSPEIQKVVKLDYIALALLLAGLVAHTRTI